MFNLKINFSYKIYFFVFLMILIIQSVQTSNNHLKIKLEREDYLLNEDVVVQLTTDYLVEEDIEIIPQYETSKILMNCTDCLNKVLGPNKKSVTLTWKTISPGSIIVFFKAQLLNSTKKKELINLKNAYFKISVGRSDTILYISEICGWCYFLAWILSMYPQIIINFNRKSVVGLNFDYVAFSLIGYSAYAIYNSCFYYLNSFKNDYYKENPHSNIPVALNDVFFSIHGVVSTLVVIFQCFIYERGDQKISHKAQCLIYLFLSPCAVLTYYLYFENIPRLEYIYFFSYIKICLTIGKYIPQAIFNYQRKSTFGWSIHNIVLDIIGGTLSILQMLFLSINYDDYKYFTKNKAKLFVGLASITFDVIFLVQHYVLYRHSDNDLEKGSNARLRFDTEQFENNSLKQSVSLDRLPTINSLSKVLNDRRKSFVHCICGYTVYGTIKTSERSLLISK